MQETNPGVPQLQGYYNQNRPPEQDTNTGFLPYHPGAQPQYPGSQFQPSSSQHEATGAQPQYPGSQFQPAGSQQGDTGAPLSRAEKIQQLRADHQRRHRERQGHYPMEDKEEEYEKQIQEEEKKVCIDP